MSLGPSPFADLLDEILRLARHDTAMAYAMHMHELLYGVPVGPALCEVRPNPHLRGTLSTTDLYRPRPGSIALILRDGDDPRFPKSAP